MKNLSFIKKIILFLNYIVALLLLLAFIAPYLPVGFLSVLSVLSLIFPYIVLLNLLFVLYWLLQFKKYMFISLLILLINYNNIRSVFQWKGAHREEPKGFVLMSYNVRLFNAYEWIKRKGVDVDISNYIKDQNPDIVCLQEFREDAQTNFKQFSYHQIALKGKKRKVGLAIFSKNKIIDKGTLNFKDTYNNAIWADILLGNDTIRVYNVHLQSYMIVHPEDLISQNKSEVSSKLRRVFDRQQTQAKLVAEHIEKTKLKTIIAGDFNNTSFSAPYRILKDNKNDAFVEAGQGFGITWKYKFVPLRIDFILPDKRIDVLQFETLNYVNFSDHFPIKALLQVHPK